MKTHQNLRIDQLDGLRGIAILLVILNHLRLDQLYAATPTIIHPLFTLLLANGKIGVGILFMLSGFLMATIYPTVSSKLAFWQKRYTRIFPAFIAMCTALVFIRYWGNSLSTYLIPIIVIIPIFLGGLLWKVIQKNPHRKQIGKLIFYSFFVLQVIVAFGYMYGLSRVPAAVFYQIWPQSLQHVFAFVINATLTIPFGNYIGQLDGVYWSLITEVFLYLLYPVVILPLHRIIVQKKSRFLSTAAFLSLFPFLFGLTILSRSVLGFSIMQVHFAIYFIIGVLLGFTKDHHYLQSITTQLIRLPSALLITLSLLGIVGLPIVQNLVHFPSLIDNMVWALPIAAVLLISLNATSQWSRILRWRPLLIIGQMSFALYITHTIAIEMFVRKVPPINFNEMVVTTFLSIVTMAALAYLLHYFLELPYFANKIPKVKEISIPIKKASIRLPKLPISITFTVTLIFLIWFGYKIPIPLTATVVNHSIPDIQELTLLGTQPIHLPFHSDLPNLGMIFISLHPFTNDEITQLGYVRGNDDKGSIKVQLNSREKEIAHNTYALYTISGSRFHPVGIPIMSDSANQDFDLIISTTPDPLHLVGLVNNGVLFRTAYFFSKKELLTNPQLLFNIALRKLSQPFTEPQALEVIELLSPLVVLVLFAQFSVKKKTEV